MEDKEYVISWSGGKDSTASIILARENNIPIKKIVFCQLMYNKYISANLSIMQDFINKSIDIFEKWGYPVEIIKGKKTAVDLAYRKYMKSIDPNKNGKYYGCTAFCRGHCKFQAEKMNIVSKTNPTVVGIAIDEPERLERLKKHGEISFLEIYNYTEKMCFKKCGKYNLLSPLYNIKGCSRDGCFFCPNISKAKIEYMKTNEKKLYDLSLNLVSMCEYDIERYKSLNNWVKEYLRVKGENK